jgi:hypothetical protein
MVPDHTKTILEPTELALWSGLDIFICAYGNCFCPGMAQLSFTQKNRIDFFYYPVCPEPALELYFFRETGNIPGIHRDYLHVDFYIAHDHLFLPHK